MWPASLGEQYISSHLADDLPGANTESPPRPRFSPTTDTLPNRYLSPAKNGTPDNIVT